MKKLVCLVLSVVMLLSLICLNVYAVDDGIHDKSQYYVDDYYTHVYDFYDNFMNGYYWPHYLTDDSSFGYVQVADDLRNNGYFQFCLSAVDFLTGISWSDFFNGEFTDDDTEIQNYVSALTSLFMTLETNLTDIRTEQAKADATMIWSDYLIEAGKVTAGAMTEITGDKSLKDIAGMQPLQTAFTTCGISVDILGDTLESFEQTQVLIENAENYLSYYDLLQVIIDNSDNSYLTTAAVYLQKAADMCFEYRVKQLSDYADTTVNATSKYFFGVLDSVIEDAKAETALLTGEWAALNYMNAAVQGIGSFKLGVDIGMFVGDVLIHSSDTILRYYEIIAMTDVRKALISEINARNTHVHGTDDWEQIENVCRLVNDLLYVNARGEYCVYMVQSEDVGLYSWVNIIKNGDKVEDWYSTVMDCIRYTQQALYGIFPNWEDFKWEEKDVENLVEDAYSTTKTYYITQSDKSRRQESVTYSIPRINLEGDGIKKTNSEIYSILMPIINEALNNISQNNYPYNSLGISYSWSLNGDILSLLIKSQGEPDSGYITEYWVYNVSVSKQKSVSNSDVFTAAGYSESKFYDEAAKTLGSKFYADNMWALDYGWEKFYLECLKNTVSDKNISESLVYLNYKAQLCVVAKQYSLVAADYYWTVVNLGDYEYHPEYLSILNNAVSPLTQDNSTAQETNQTLDLSKDEQKRINLFLSNFSEAFFGSMTSVSEIDPYYLVDFAYIHMRINDYNSVFSEHYNNKSYYCVTRDKVDGYLNKYFGTTVPPKSYSCDIDGYNYTIEYHDGKYYFEQADGENYNRLTIVKTVEKDGSNTFKISFDVYEIDWDIFFEQEYWDGIDSRYYELTAEEATANSELNKLYSGTAIVQDNTDGALWLISYDVGDRKF